MRSRSLAAAPEDLTRNNHGVCLIPRAFRA